jgi:hypothetical protein
MRNILILAILLVFASPAFADNYYVCGSATSCNAGDGTEWSTGNDSNTCTSKADPCLTIGAGLEEMDSADGVDTLIIGDGTYTGYDNYINSNYHTMQSGTSTSNMVVIRAENDFMVTVDASGETVVQDWAYSPMALQSVDYIQVRGIKAIGIGDLACGQDGTCNSIGVISSSYIHLYRVIGQDGTAVTYPFGDQTGGDNNDSTNALIKQSSYVTIEESAFYGAGHYTLSIFTGSTTIVRDVLARHDYHGMGAAGTIDNYSSSDISIQSSIVIDFGDPTYYYHDPGAGLYGGFSSHGSTGYTEYLGCIAFNIEGPTDIPINRLTGVAMTSPPGWMGGFYAQTSSEPGDTRKLENCIAYNTASSVMLWRSDDTVNNCSIINSNEYMLDGGNDGYGVFGYTSASPTVTNTLFLNIAKDAIGGGESSSNDYNSFYEIGGTQCQSGGDCAGSNNVTYNPETNGLLYPTRIETGATDCGGSPCDLASAGSGGGRIGADTTYAYGRSYTDTGIITFWGDPGYNARQDGTDQGDGVEPTRLMWPFPNEDVFRTHMKAYTATDPYAPPGHQTVSGDRGFAADGMTLTKYIWEALGNDCPDEICGAGSEPPVSTGIHGNFRLN